MPERDRDAGSGTVPPLVIAFALWLVAQLVRAGWMPSAGDIPARVHGEMLAAALGIAAAVVAAAGGFELRRRSRVGARAAATAVAVAALVALAAEVVGVIAFARALGQDTGPARDDLSSLAVDAANVRAVALLGLACALAIAAWPGRATRGLGLALVAAVAVGMPLPAYAGALGRALGSSTALRAAIAAVPAAIGIALAWSLRPATAPAVEPARVRAALLRAASAMMALVALAAASILVAVAMFVRKTTDPTGLAVVVTLAHLVVLGGVVVALVSIPATGAPRAALSLAAAVLATYLGLGLVHLVEVLRIFLGGETPGTLSTDGRAALPDALPIAVPAVLCAGWVVVGFGLRAVAAGLDLTRDRAERRALAAGVGRTALTVLGCQLGILGVLAYLDRADDLSRNGALTGATVLAGLAIASLLQLVAAARALAAAHA